MLKISSSDTNSRNATEQMYKERKPAMHTWPVGWRTNREEKFKVSRLWPIHCSNWGTTKGKKDLGWIKWAYEEWRLIFCRGSVAPRLYLMKGESENLQFPLSTTISSSISSKIINLATEKLFFFFIYIYNSHITH